MCIDEVAQDARHRDRNDPPADVGEIAQGDPLHHGLERECVHEMRNGACTDCIEQYSKERRPAETLLDDAPNLTRVPCPVVLCNDRSESRDQSDECTEYGEEDARADGNAREILLADVSRHDRIEESRCHEGNLRDQDGKEHDEELPCTCRIAVNLLQGLPPLSSIIQNSLRFHPQCRARYF